MSTTDQMTPDGTSRIRSALEADPQAFASAVINLFLGYSVIKQTAMAKATVVCPDGQPQKMPPLRKPN